jgi:hypothetical protein
MPFKDEHGKLKKKDTYQGHIENPQRHGTLRSVTGGQHAKNLESSPLSFSAKIKCRTRNQNIRLVRNDTGS